MALTDALRAAVYARDKAICSFSGISLWLLDYGTAPFTQVDWPDHIKPRSRGGADAMENLVCSSYFYNRKKMNNGWDKEYLFREGRPTETFFWSHGTLTVEQAIILRRHQAIAENDWYFNRALFHISVALDQTWSGFEAVRDAEYWKRAAWKRLKIWRQRSSEAERDFLGRGLVLHTESPDVQLMLALRSADETKMNDIFKRLVRYYSANASIMEKFATSRSSKHRESILSSARSNKFVTAPLLSSLTTNHQHLQQALL